MKKLLGWSLIILLAAGFLPAKKNSAAGSFHG